MLSSSNVCLVNRDSCVNNLGLDNLLVDNRNNSLMDVVVDMLSCHSRGGGLCMASLVLNGLVLEVGHLSGKALLGTGLIVVMKFAVLGGEDVVCVLLGQYLLGSQGLDSGVVVMLNDLSVDSLCSLLVNMGLDGLMCDGRHDILLNRSMVSPVAGKLRNGCSCCFHCD